MWDPDNKCKEWIDTLNKYPVQDSGYESDNNKYRAVINHDQLQLNPLIPETCHADQTSLQDCTQQQNKQHVTPFALNNNMTSLLSELDSDYSIRTEHTSSVPPSLSATSQIKKIVDSREQNQKKVQTKMLLPCNYDESQSDAVSMKTYQSSVCVTGDKNYNRNNDFINSHKVTENYGNTLDDCSSKTTMNHNNNQTVGVNKNDKRGYKNREIHTGKSDKEEYASNENYTFDNRRDTSFARDHTKRHIIIRLVVFVFFVVSVTLSCIIMIGLHSSDERTVDTKTKRVPCRLLYRFTQNNINMSSSVNEIRYDRDLVRERETYDSLTCEHTFLSQLNGGIFLLDENTKLHVEVSDPSLVKKGGENTFMGYFLVNDLD